MKRRALLKEPSADWALAADVVAPINNAASAKARHRTTVFQ